jgi:hypothetical protein
MTHLNAIWRAIIEKGGKLRFDDNDGLRAFLMSFKEGSEVEVVVKQRKRLRSLNQNSYYWAYLRLISEETGNLEDDLHEAFKKEFVPSEKLSIFGIEVPKYKTTTSLSTMEFSEYIKNIEVRTGILAPDINKLDY